MDYSNINWFELKGSHVFNDDCMNGLRSMPDKCMDLAICDPPYRDENQPTQDMRNNGSMKTIEGRPPKSYWNELLRVSKHQIIWGANNFELSQWKGFVVWKKKTISEDFTMSMCEIAALSEGLATVSKWIEMKPQDPCRIHPTQKPVHLYKWLLTKYAKLGWKILDTHMGSQSSRIAAYQMGFDYYGWEIDKDYFETGNKRFKEQTAQLKLL